MRKKRKVQSEKRKVKVQSLKFLVFSFAFWILSFAFISGCAKYEIKNIDSQGKNIICFGNSITFGYGVQTGEDFPSQLAKKLDIPVINAGKDGDTSSDALGRLEEDVLEKEPLLVIIEFGGNDFLKKIPLSITLENINKMVEKILAKKAMVALVDISTEMLLTDYYSRYKRLAKNKGLIFIPRLLKGIITNPQLKSDFIHPNAGGYKIIAERIYQIIIPYLNQNKLKRQF